MLDGSPDQNVMFTIGPLTWPSAGEPSTAAEPGRALPDRLAVGRGPVSADSGRVSSHSGQVREQLRAGGDDPVRTRAALLAVHSWQLSLKASVPRPPNGPCVVIPAGGAAHPEPSQAKGTRSRMTAEHAGDDGGQPSVGEPW